MKRDKDRMKVARMERLELRRKEWEVKKICSSIMKELVDEMEPFRMEVWVKEVDEIIQTLELDNERYTRSTEVMGEEEEWLKDMVNRMVEPRLSPTTGRPWGWARRISISMSTWSSSIWNG